VDVWVVRAGEGGRFVDAFETTGVISIQVEGVGDVAAFSGHEILERLLTATDMGPGKAQSHAATLYRFAREMKVGDFVITPDRERGELVIGRIAGDYEFKKAPPVDGLQHLRPVDWLGRVAWGKLPQQVRRTLGAPMAVFKPGAQQAVFESLKSLVEQ
jgi:predicted Mrr-cat superfamily restriction endonuclease